MTTVTQTRGLRCAKVAVSLAVVLLASAVSPSQGQDASQFDLSTNGGVNAAREALAGRKLDSHSLNCLRRGKTLPIIAVGSFAFDWGCRFDGVFVKSRLFKPGEEQTWKEALDLLGWPTANTSEREKLALAWIEESWLAFIRVVTEKNEDFTKPAFQPPMVITNANGEVVVTLWTNPPGRGRVKGRSYQQREFKFASSGAFISARTVNSFTVAKDDGS